MKRAKHNLSHYRLTTFNQGQLYPVACLEVLPGDTFRHQSSMLLRVTPLATPVMHPVHVSIHSYFVPNRIIWDGWEDFITDASASDSLPTINVAHNDTSLTPLATALGIGVTGTTTVAANSLPFRAYNLIWNEFYRDQDLSTPLTVPTGSSDNPDYYEIRNVSWQKDYFTTARANPQQGTDTSVVSLDLNLGTAPVTGFAIPNTSSYTGNATGLIDAAGNNPPSGTDWTTPASFKVQGNNTTKVPNLRADLSNLTGSASMDINEWRRAMAYQKIRENRNRFGSRYRDYLAFLGVNCSDARLQRPEYLGGGKQTISFSEVLSTATTAEGNTGELAGHGIAALRTRPYRRFFEEHGYVITLAFVRPKTVYQTQVPRHFLRRTWSDYWQKELEMMGDQAVSNVEVYFGAAAPNDVFGYVPRYDDYRHHPSYVSGEFRTTLDDWHMARQFSSQPVLNSSFVTADPTDRIYQSTTVDELQAMISHRITAGRLVAQHARN